MKIYLSRSASSPPKLQKANGKAKGGEFDRRTQICEHVATCLAPLDMLALLSRSRPCRFEIPGPDVIKSEPQGRVIAHPRC